jgi:hypothetical protein
VTDIAWIDAALASARPQALGALIKKSAPGDNARAVELILQKNPSRLSKRRRFVRPWGTARASRHPRGAGRTIAALHISGEGTTP